MSETGAIVSESTKKQAKKKVEAKSSPKKAAPNERKPKVAKAPINPCGCGCGELVVNNFRMGHDGRFHGWLKRLAAGKMSLKELPTQVRKGMYSGAVDSDKGVKPTSKETDYLASLKKN